MPKPTGLTHEQAATIPGAFITAYYALWELARLNQRELVLIHSAAGGVGLAAIQVARWKGAEIFATAGNPGKRDYLRSLGIQHVMDSKSLAFAEEVLTLTGGEGVDVILNSLPGEAIPKGLQIMRPFGRFLELGRKDFFENMPVPLWPFHKCLTLAAVNLNVFAAGIQRAERELTELFANGVFEPLPMRTLPISKAADALAYMAQGKHIGKIVLLIRDQQVLVESS
jgi:NADPH:quinone reductase-like Zn-dependent oxidoreductase